MSTPTGLTCSDFLLIHLNLLFHLHSLLCTKYIQTVSSIDTTTNSHSIHVSPPPLYKKFPDNALTSGLTWKKPRYVSWPKSVETVHLSCDNVQQHKNALDQVLANNIFWRRLGPGRNIEKQDSSETPKRTEKNNKLAYYTNLYYPVKTLFNNKNLTLAGNRGHEI